MSLEMANLIKQEKESAVLYRDDRVNYLPHQLVSGAWLAEVKRGLLWDDMGTGKTYSAIFGLSYLEHILGQAIKVVLLSPGGSVLSWWADCISKFLGWKVIIMEGDRNQRDVKFSWFKECMDSIVLISTYSRPLRDEKQMLALNPTGWIFDEATGMKNIATKIYRLIYNSIKSENFVWSLSGTPNTLTLADVYWEFNMLQIPGVVSSYEEEVEPLLVKTGKNIYSKVIGAEQWQDFMSKIEPYTMRHSLAEVESLDDELLTSFDMDIQVVPLTISQSQKDCFNALKQKANAESRLGNYKPLRYYADFYMAASSPKLIGYDSTEEPKVKFIEDYMSEVSKGEKVIIFARYLKYLELLRISLSNLGFSVVKVSGEDSSMMDERLREFSQGETQILLLSEVGKFGLNLQFANHIIFLSLPRNPADFLQIIARVRRLGQNKTVHIRMCFMENTIEEDSLRDLCSRQKLHDNLFKDTNMAKFLERDTPFVRGFLEKDYS